MIDVNGMAQKIYEWHKATFPGKNDVERVLKLTEECGEATAAMLKRTEVRRGERHEPEDKWTGNYVEELGDILNVVLALACYEGLDIEEWFTESAQKPLGMVFK